MAAPRPAYFDQDERRWSYVQVLSAARRSTDRGLLWRREGCGVQHVGFHLAWRLLHGEGWTVLPRHDCALSVRERQVALLALLRCCCFWAGHDDDWARSDLSVACHTVCPKPSEACAACRESHIAGPGAEPHVTAILTRRLSAAMHRTASGGQATCSTP